MNKISRKRLFFMLRITAIGAFLIYVFQSIYADFFPCNQRDIAFFAIWLLIFMGQSTCGRYFVKRPVFLSGGLWIAMYVGFVITSTFIFLPGSLYIRIGLFFLYFFSLPTPEMRGAGTLLFIFVTLLMLYIHYSILSYDEEGMNKTFFQKGNEVLVLFSKYRGWFLWPLFFILAAYGLWYYINTVLHTPGMIKVSHMHIANSTITYPVGTDFHLKVEGTYTGGKHRSISHSKFGTVYSVSDSSIAAISKNGVVRGLKPGEFRISVKNGNCETSRLFRIISPDEIVLSSDANEQEPKSWCGNGVQPFIALAFFIAAFTRARARARRK